MIFFFLLLLVTMFVSLIVQHFVGPLPMMGARVLLMQLVMFYGSLAMPTWGMLGLAFAGGLMWDALHTQVAPELMVADKAGIREAGVEIAMGWSIVLYGALCTIMSGFRPLFQRGRWEVHCLLSGVLTSAMVLAEYIMITIRREPVVFIFNKEVAWRIGGAGLVAMLLSPLLFFGLNYLAAVVGYDPQPDRFGRKRQ